MKNIHVLKTDKPSRLVKFFTNKFHLCEKILPIQDEEQYQHIYITNSEEIKEGDWCLSTDKNFIIKQINLPAFKCDKKVILTTDQDLIQDGIQAIDDEFLEWFVKNSSCEWVEVQKWSSLAECGYSYHTIIPKEEPIQETIEEVAEKEFPLIDTEWCRTGAAEEENLQLLGHRRSFIKGAKWQQERMYSEVFEWLSSNDYLSDSVDVIQKQFEQFKKK